MLASKISRHVQPADADELLRWLAADAVVADDPVDPPNLIPLDPADAFVVALAMAKSAVLVTGNQRLLALGNSLPYARRRSTWQTSPEAEAGSAGRIADLR